MSQTLCYLRLNGNKVKVAEHLEQRAGNESCIVWYNLDKKRPEIVIDGYRHDLAKELAGCKVSLDDIDLC